MRRLAPALLLLSASCEGEPAPLGLEALLRVAGAQRIDGAPAGDQGGPAVTAVELGATRFPIGAGAIGLHGRVEEAATAVRLSLEGEGAHWLLPAGLPDPATPGTLAFDASLSIAPHAPEGAQRLRLQAVDAAGRGGPPTSVGVTLVEALPEAPLVVQLAWEARADLDLWLVLPDGRVLSPDEPSAYEPPAPGRPPDDPSAWESAPFLDRDAGADCAFFGALREHALFPGEVPAGSYAAFVDLPAPCGAAAAPFRLRVLRDGLVVHEVSGVLYPEDARRREGGDGPPGLAALSWTLP